MISVLSLVVALWPFLRAARGDGRTYSDSSR